MRSLAELSVIDRSNRLGEFAALARYKMLGRGVPTDAVALAKKGGASPRVLEILARANVAPGGVPGAGDWGQQLLGTRLVMGGFSDSLAHVSAFAAVVNAGLIVRVPLGSSIGLVMSATSAATEVDAASPTPAMRQLDVSQALVSRRKVAAFVALTRELLRQAPGEAESIITRSLRASVASGIDSAFVDTLLDGVQEFTASGSPITDAENLLVAVRPTSTSRPFWVVGASAAIRLATRHTANVRAAPDVSPTNGGSFMGIPLFIVDNDVANDMVLLADGAGLAGNLAEAELDRSTESSVELETSPTGGVAGSPAAVTPLGATARVSLWQEDCEAVKVVQHFGIAKLRSSSVAATFTGGSAA